MLNGFQINQKIIPNRPFHRAIDETVKIPEMSWLVLYRSSALPAHAYEVLIINVCVQIVSVIRESLSISVHC